MAVEVPAKGLQLRSNVRRDGKLELSLVEVTVAEPGPDDVVVRVEATPINPSDLGLLVGGADLSTAAAGGTAELPTVLADVPARALQALSARVDLPLPVGNEGAGVVIAAGAGPQAQALLGRKVAIVGGEMYAQYRVLNANQCSALPDEVDVRAGASSFVNPLTALGMTETMRLEGHQALVHTAAASNLGQMLNRICLADGIPLVNIVRREEQAELLRKLGAKYVVDSTHADFRSNLVDALAETKATLAFDAIGGGPLAGQILSAMEKAASRDAPYSRYGSAVMKQVYVYGHLDMEQTTLPPTLGMAWSVGGWLLTYFLQRIGSDGRKRLQQRVLDELTTTFASQYSEEISLRQALDVPTLQAYNRKATGKKYLIRPHW